MSGHEAVTKWRNKTKQKLIDSLGGKCCICNYNKCKSALEFHHLDPSKKDFGLGKWKHHNWSKLIIEIRKCILVCSNCHREIHDNIISIPKDVKRFDETYADLSSNFIKSTYQESRRCIKCNKIFSCLNTKRQLSCSKSCAAQRIDWSKIDLYGELKNKSVSSLARSLGITHTSVYKRMKKLGIPTA